MLVSVCMIVRNEESNLERALNSIPKSYEKIVIDTGSTDNSKEVARSLGARVYDYTWIDDFAAARNYSLSQASGTYILVMDADEELSSEIEIQVEQFVSQYPDAAGTVNILNKIKDEVHKHRMVRFFPNNKTYMFSGIVHETLYQHGQPTGFVSSELTIYHYGYQEELYSNGVKVDRYLNLYNKHLEKDPYDGYMVYQLAKLHYSQKELGRALEALERCLEINQRERLYYPVMVVMLGYVLKDMGQSKLAWDLLEPLQAEFPYFPDLPFLLGLLAMETGKINNIEACYMRALEIGETTKYSSVDGVGSYKSEYNLAVYYEVTGNLNMALQYYKKAAAAQYLPAQERLLKLA
ncbi:tetratricopeptide repeat-containing glycosyltransferase family 2 protein [Paenibacillus aestuarii]|uniref:Glycosyltransferase n=1 Tax=Paenibacillus aestuarii TaxID=516965 RepID=A0ABW0K643_9BACL|nr:glycosyltransferase family 2 protein [Paenibacillus aestuarii]